MKYIMLIIMFCAVLVFAACSNSPAGTCEDCAACPSGLMAGDDCMLIDEECAHNFVREDGQCFEVFKSEDCDSGAVALNWGPFGAADACVEHVCNTCEQSEQALEFLNWRINPGASAPAEAVDNS